MIVVLVGIADKVKSVGALTTNVTDVVCTSPPPAAVIVNGYVPSGVDDVVLTVRVITQDPVPAHGADHPVNFDIPFGLAVSVTTVPCA